METKPIFVGKAPQDNLQDYALTAFSYEDVDSELIQNYEKNNTKIILEKKDKETKNPLKGAKFEILDKNQKIIRVVETDENGQIIMDQLMPGTYYIREVKAPEGYALDLEMKQIDIKLNEQIVTTIKTEKTEEKIVEIIEKKQVVEIPKLPVTGM